MHHLQRLVCPCLIQSTPRRPPPPLSARRCQHKVLEAPSQPHNHLHHRWSLMTTFTTGRWRSGQYEVLCATRWVSHANVTTLATAHNLQWIFCHCGLGNGGCVVKGCKDKSWRVSITCTHSYTRHHKILQHLCLIIAKALSENFVVNIHLVSTKTTNFQLRWKYDVIIY